VQLFTYVNFLFFINKSHKFHHVQTSQLTISPRSIADLRRPTADRNSKNLHSSAMVVCCPRAVSPPRSLQATSRRVSIFVNDNLTLSAYRGLSARACTQLPQLLLLLLTLLKVLRQQKILSSTADTADSILSVSINIVMRASAMSSDNYRHSDVYFWKIWLIFTALHGMQTRYSDNLIWFQFCNN